MTTISISNSVHDQLVAAQSVSKHLDTLKCPHAYIGGFAWALLGSPRTTEISRDQLIVPQSQDCQGLNVLVETQNFDILALREKLTGLNKQFASAGIKFFYVKELIGDLQDDDLVKLSKGNVMIEFLRAGSMGLPVVAGPLFNVEQESGPSIGILHPSILILTKMRRWSTSQESDRPQTVLKSSKDRSDLEFMLKWLAKNKMFIEFNQYQGKSKSDLLKTVRVYRNKFISDAVLMNTLKMVIRPKDWEELCGEAQIE